MIRELWAVYVKQETTYADNTHSTITASNVIHAFADKVSVEIDNDIMRYDANPLLPIKQQGVVETSRVVKFSFELPIKYAVTPEIDAILKSAGFTPSSGIYTFDGNDNTSLAIRFVSDRRYVVVCKGAKITSITFEAKPGELVTAKVEGVGLFQSEQVISDTLTPSYNYTQLYRAKATSVTGDLARHITNFSWKITNTPHITTNFTADYTISRIYIAGSTIEGSFQALVAANEILKFVGDALTISVTFLDESSDRLVVSFSSPILLSRKMTFDTVLYQELQFAAAGHTIQFQQAQ